MSDDATIANADLAEIARLRVDVAHRDQTIAQQERALDAERAARRTAEANAGWWHATVANYVTSATTEDRRILREAMAEAVTYPHPGAQLLAELDAARAVVAAARTYRSASPLPYGIEDAEQPLWAALDAYNNAAKARNE